MLDYPLMEPIPIPPELTHLHPEATAYLADPDTWIIESLSEDVPHDVHVDEFGHPTRCSDHCKAWLHKREDVTFVWCWHCLRVLYYAEQCAARRQRTRQETSTLSSNLPFSFLK